MNDIPDRDELQALADKPIGDRALQGDDPNSICFQPEAVEAARRASKKWLPAGRKAVSGKAIKEAESAFYERQTDIEDAVEAAGGERGHA